MTEHLRIDPNFVKATIVESDYERGYKDGNSHSEELRMKALDHICWLEQRVEELERQKDAFHVKVWKFWHSIQRLRSL